MKIRILKTTMVAGNYVEPGAELDVPKQLAVELCTSKKAERVESSAKPGVMTSTGTKPSDPPKA